MAISKRLGACAAALVAVAACAPAASSSPRHERGVYIASAARGFRTPVARRVVHAVAWIRHPEVFTTGSIWHASFTVDCRYRYAGKARRWHRGVLGDWTVPSRGPARRVLTLQVPRRRGSCYASADVWSASVVKRTASVNPELRVAIFYTRVPSR
jgi:hypothetical protein